MGKIAGSSFGRDAIVSAALRRVAATTHDQPLRRPTRPGPLASAPLAGDHKSGSIDLAPPQATKGGLGVTSGPRGHAVSSV